MSRCRLRVLMRLLPIVLFYVTCANVRTTVLCMGMRGKNNTSKFRSSYTIFNVYCYSVASSYELRVSINNHSNGSTCHSNFIGNQNIFAWFHVSASRTITSISLLHVFRYAYVCLFMHIVQNQWICICDKQEPSIVQLLQHKICTDLFLCCSWDLSLPLDATNSFQADRLFFLFFWLHWTQKSCSYDVLLWTNIIDEEREEKKINF